MVGALVGCTVVAVVLEIVWVVVVVVEIVVVTVIVVAVSVVPVIVVAVVENVLPPPHAQHAVLASIPPTA